MSTEGFETIGELKLRHLPNDSRLVIQRQRGPIIREDTVQFGLPSTFVNPDNGQTVWNRGPSIQLEQMPELIEMLSRVYKKYSGGKTQSECAKTNTFADMCE